MHKHKEHENIIKDLFTAPSYSEEVSNVFHHFIPLFCKFNQAEKSQQFD